MHCAYNISKICFVFYWNFVYFHFCFILIQTTYFYLSIEIKSSTLKILFSYLSGLCRKCALWNLTGSVNYSMVPISLMKSSGQVIHSLLSSVVSLTVLAVSFTAKLSLSLALVRQTQIYLLWQFIGCPVSPTQIGGVECHPSLQIVILDAGTIS